MNHERLAKLGMRSGLTLLRYLYKLSQTITVQHIPIGIGVMQGTTNSALIVKLRVSNGTRHLIFIVDLQCLKKSF